MFNFNKCLNRGKQLVLHVCVCVCDTTNKILISFSLLCVIQINNFIEYATAFYIL